MKVNIEKKDGKIFVYVSVSSFDNPSCNERIKMRSDAILRILSDQNISNIGKCLKHDKINNFRGNTSGVWIYEDLSVRPKIKAVPPRRAPSKKKAKKVEKKLDKSEKDVIIEVQEKTLPSKED
jgi:hypothetical protein